MGSESLTLRHYGLHTGDWQTVSGWYAARHGAPLPETLLPPLGVMCEDADGPAGVMFAYQSAGIGVAFIDPIVTRPQMAAEAAHAVLGRALEGIEAVLRKEGYSLLRCFTESEALARAVGRHGFTGTNRNLAKRID